ncbi:ABC-2 type transport system ATP-binding protein [Amycolatopsis lexingtonensis]|uniref:ABC-2 type transport system ATP-binding protein n=1 Tax=Amycolatopsis lexingtonensis TaxID=218822 RepID=A0ABR9HT18_9PSEU|nr:ABC transporter ATP-binding protein [Amycolatopsis lexingtonensis]MBE1494067.1 ABC-2 type transport system ATP-binding protein [Amycolatopsis lexingtonensis]
MAGETVIRVEGLTKVYGRTEALRDVSFEIGPGEVFGYLGPNGAGKTTTLRLLMGMIRPTAGTAEVAGADSWRDAVAVHRAVGYVPGDTRLYDRLTGRQHVTYFGHLRGDPTGKRAEVLADRLDLDLDRPARSLSKGNRQKLAVVLALMSAPRVLILDEPSSGLDPLVQHEFHALLREHTTTGGSVLFSSHVLAEVQRVADRIGVLRAGRLVTVDRVDDLRAKSLHHVRARFADDVPAAVFAAVPGVRDVAVDGGVLTCGAPEAALDALVKRIAQHRLLDFECVEADLEETFLTYYGPGTGDAA